MFSLTDERLECFVDKKIDVVLFHHNMLLVEPPDGMVFRPDVKVHHISNCKLSLKGLFFIEIIPDVPLVLPDNSIFFKNTIDPKYAEYGIFIDEQTKIGTLIKKALERKRLAA